MGIKPFKRLASGAYQAQRTFTREELIHFAKVQAGYSLRRNADVLSSPEKVRNFLTFHLTPEPNEQFWILFMDNRHRVLKHESVFFGTIDGAAVYPRVIVQKSLQHNAAALILAHNHPSGVAEPSDTDVRLTRKLVDALALIDVRILDHLVVGNGTITSMAERGLM